MTRRARPLLRLAVSALLLAGTSARAAEPTGETYPWNLIECRYVYVTAPALASRVAPYLPPGFQPALIERVGGPALTQIAFEMERCVEGSGLEDQIAPMIYAQSSVPVLPPAAYQVEQLGTYVKFHPLIPDAERRELFRTRGMPAHDGSVEIGLDPDALVPGPFTATTTYDGIGTFELDLVAGASDLPGGGEFVQYLAGAEASLSYWRTRWAADSAFRTAGVITLPASSWEADAFGTTIVPVRGSAGVWSYTDGKVVLPD